MKKNPFKAKALKAKQAKQSPDEPSAAPLKFARAATPRTSPVLPVGQPQPVHSSIAPYNPNAANTPMLIFIIGSLFIVVGSLGLSVAINLDVDSDGTIEVALGTESSSEIDDIDPSKIRSTSSGIQRDRAFGVRGRSGTGSSRMNDNIFGTESSRANREPRSPKSVSDCIELLDESHGMMEFDKKQRKLALDWLLGNTVDETKRRDVAIALGASARGIRSDSANREKFLNAFEKWGHEIAVNEVAQHHEIFINESKAFLSCVNPYANVQTAKYVVQFMNSNNAQEVGGILERIGPDCAAVLHPYINSNIAAVSQMVRRLFDKWDVDADQMKIIALIDKMNDRWKRADALSEISLVPFNDKYQKMIGEALTANRPEINEHEAWIDAIYVWGNADQLADVHTLVKGNLHGFDNVGKIKEYLLKYPDNSTLRMLVTKILDEANAFDRDSWLPFASDYAKKHPTLDYQNIIHQPILLKLHGFGIRDSRQKLLQLLQVCNCDPNLIVDQCLSDLKESSKNSAALATLNQVDLIEDRRHEVANAIGSTIRNFRFSTLSDEQECFLRWATPDNEQLFSILNESVFGGDAWKKALLVVVKGDDPSKYVVGIDNALNDRFKEDDTKAVLRSMGADAERILAYIVEHTSYERSAYNACEILAYIGTSESIPALRAMRTNANKSNSTKYLGEYAKKAIELIKARSEGGSSDEDDD
jgi:hypothetical protein